MTSSAPIQYMVPPRHPRGPVMVVDDDRLVLLTLAHGLRHAGFEVLEADNGDDAILMARAHRPGLVLLDIRMQGLSGFDVAQHLKDYERIPFLFVSAYADEDIRQQAQALGALACLSKPVDMPDLIRRVHQVFEHAPAAAAAESADGAAVHGLTPPPAGDSTLGTEAALALGLLMQRRSLTRGEAWAYLKAWSQSQGLDLDDSAKALLVEHEQALPRRGGRGAAL